MWARIRSWYPSQICYPEEIPDKFKKLIPDHPTDNIFAKRFEPFSNVRIVKAKYIDDLGENRIDKIRAAKSENINEAYFKALATIMGDI